ncbi:hypothetical protein CDAR_423421 [Caerostris darwini]|uniref:Uncharacterized protein n=1 Tax=Caerostris darwini TaxID=1538125 RepID=A0AAV4TIB8_9ARAC|nr:hypothetical protein CDAR_423421 [Caerostris darwini]
MTAVTQTEILRDVSAWLVVAIFDHRIIFKSMAAGDFLLVARSVENFHRFEEAEGSACGGGGRDVGNRTQTAGLLVFTRWWKVMRLLHGSVCDIVLKTTSVE